MLEISVHRLVDDVDPSTLFASIAEFGAWEDEEIAGWSNEEIDALVLQYAAGDLREAQAICPGNGLAGINWRQYDKESEAGTISGRLFRHNSELWISLD